MVQSRVIRIDEDVWDQLKARAQPFEDSPNTVLRRVFGLDIEKAKNDGNQHNERDSRILRLIDLVKSVTREDIDVRYYPTSRQYSVRSKTGIVFAYLIPQKRRMKIAAKKDSAEQAGFTNFQHEVKRGWFNSSSEVYWYVADKDEESYMAASRMLATLWSENR